MKFIPLAFFTDYIEAHIIMGRMIEHGVNCWLNNEIVATVLPLWTPPVGGIQLMVYQDHWHKASFLLKEIGEEKNSTLPPAELQ